MDELGGKGVTESPESSCSSLCSYAYAFTKRRRIDRGTLVILDLQVRYVCDKEVTSFAAFIHI